MAIGGRRAAAWRDSAAGMMLAAAVLAWPASVGSQTPAPREAPAPRETSVNLAWRTDWTPTGVTVEPGDTLSISIRAVQPPRSPREAYAQAQGGSLTQKFAEAAALQAFFGRLDEGPPFLVGRDFRKVMKKGGLLSLRWNVPREMAGAGAFSAAIRVEPAPPPNETGEGGNGVASNGNTGANDQNQAEVNNSNSIPDVPAVDNRSGDEPVNVQDNVAGPNVSVAIPPREPEETPVTVDEATADGSEAGLSTAQIALLAGAVAGLLLVLAGAGLALKQRSERLRLKRTRELLHVSPSLDLDEGECRGADPPAEGPETRFAARLDTGALRWTGGGEDE